MGNEACENQTWYAITQSLVSAKPMFQETELSRKLDRRYPKNIKEGDFLIVSDSKASYSWNIVKIGWLCSDPCTVVVHMRLRHTTLSQVFVLTHPDLLRVSASQGFDRTVGGLLYESSVKGETYDDLLVYIQTFKNETIFDLIYQSIYEYANDRNKHVLKKTTAQEVNTVNDAALLVLEQASKPTDLLVPYIRRGAQTTDLVYRGGKF